jgi:drug/metabolite transporter (DMT)-like permease
MPSKLSVHLALFTVALLYAANYSIAKIAMPAFIGPFGFIVIRATIAGMIFWAYHYLFIKEKVTARSDMFRLLLCGIFGVAANQLAFFKGLSMTTPINASIIMTINPIIVVTLAYFAKMEKITPQKIIGILIAGISVYFFLTKDGASFNDNHFLGDFLILINASSYGIYLVLAKPLMIKYNPMTVVKWMFFFGSLIVIPFGWNELMAVEWSTFPINIWVIVLYVVLGVTVLAYFLNAWGLQYVDSSVVSIYIYLQPILATIVATLLGSDALTWADTGYAVLIMSGVYIVSRK